MWVKQKKQARLGLPGHREAARSSGTGRAGIMAAGGPGQEGSFVHGP